MIEKTPQMVAEEAFRALEHDLVIARYFAKPKCKPWDIVKGRRYECCHSLISTGHIFWCFGGLIGKTIIVQKVGEIKEMSKAIEWQT